MLDQAHQTYFSITPFLNDIFDNKGLYKWLLL